MQKIRKEIEVCGIVQGVGFRPFVYRLATTMGLFGWVSNSGGRVIICVEGIRTDIDNFLIRLRLEAPKASKIENITCCDISHSGSNDDRFINYSNMQYIDKETKGRSDSFFIAPSDNDFGINHGIFISPDIGICDDCKSDITNPSNRRFKHPFTNCTNCGPRFTIIDSLPYDRCSTSMSKFKLCENCREEYQNPLDRRYHAQTTSCMNCSPNLKILNKTGECLQVSDPLDFATIKLKDGNLLAIKGIGGFHIACDAKNETSILRLRSLKKRESKPLALMAKDYETALKYCDISEKEKEILISSKKPILLLKKRQNLDLPKEISFNSPYIGIMLPYTGTQHLLFQLLVERTNGVVDILVMTSGNESNQPMQISNYEAVRDLGNIVDYFLVNDIDILTRIDDSVTRVVMGSENIIRVGRGYSPSSYEVNNLNPGTQKCMTMGHSILACGADLKNTFCINEGNRFYMSQYIGDLDNIQTFDSFKDTISRYERLFQINPNIIAYDLHPQYVSTKYALESSIKTKVPVQHHHAHIAACMIDNAITDRHVIGVAFDGTGYGEDGCIWGGEFFAGKYSNFKRVAHLDYIKMPGGEAAIREPWRMGVSYLRGYGLSCDEICEFVKSIEREKIEAMISIMDCDVNSPLTSSAGRLFDAISSIIGLCDRVTYEGQAAIELENIAEKRYRECSRIKSYNYNVVIGSECAFIVDVNEVIRGIIYDLRNNVLPSVISIRFHETVSNIIVEICDRIRKLYGIEDVVLSGGVFQNILLIEKSVVKLRKSGFNVYFSKSIPANDSGISMGQAIIALDSWGRFETTKK